MHITIVPASGQIARQTISILLADPSNPKVRGVYRNLDRVPAELRSHPRFTAVKGDIEDGSSLDVSGSDAVFTVQPPIYDGRDTIAHTKAVSENTKAAVKKSGTVKRFVYLSSVGAQYDHEVGEIVTNHTAEQVFKDTAPEVVYVRGSYFMENWGEAVKTIQEQDMFYSTLSPVDHPLPHVATKDLAAVAASELLKTGQPLPANPYVFEVRGTSYTTGDVLRAWEEAAGKKLKVHIIPKEDLAGFYSGIFPPGTAERFAEMNESYLPGGILERNPEPTPEIRGAKTELVEVFREMLGRA